MTDVNIECPHCHKSFKLNETLAAPLVEETRRKYQREFEQKDEALEERRKVFAEEQRAGEKVRKANEKERTALAKQKEQIEEQVTERVEEQRAAIAREEAKKVKKKYDQKLVERDEEKAELEATIKKKDQKLAEARKAELETRKKQRELDEKIQAVDVDVEKRVEEQRTAIAREEAKQAKKRYDQKLVERDEEKAELEATIKEKDEKLTLARKAELETRKKQRELDDKIQALDVDVEKRLEEAIRPVREKARKEADEVNRLRIAEKEKVIEDQKRQLAEAQRKLEQGSQQLQGEIQELDLERTLRAAFPRDTIEPVPKGQFGGDAVHRVLGARGQVCGTILWEAKRTKNWAAKWPDKLKQDQRAARADLAVIVTQAMPKSIESFGELEGVWVTTPALAIPLATALRLGLEEAALARRASEGQQGKMEILYQYLTGPTFRQRVEAIKDAFITMQEDLDAEKRLITKQWAKRQQQIERVMVSTVGMYGELQAIAGKTLPEIEGLALKMPES